MTILRGNIGSWIQSLDGPMGYQDGFKGKTGFSFVLLFR